MPAMVVTERQPEDLMSSEERLVAEYDDGRSQSKSGCERAEVGQRMEKGRKEDLGACRTGWPFEGEKWSRYEGGSVTVTVCV